MANSSRYLTVIVILVLESFLVNSQSKTLLKHLQTKDNAKNIVFSPFLLAEILAQLYLGSNGTTADELKNVIPYVTNNPNMNMELYLAQDRKNIKFIATFQFANRLFVNNSMHIYQEYETRINTIFEAMTQKVDFRSESTIKEINEWVAQQTNNKIINAIRELNGDEIFIIVSTIYFKGLWKHPFSNTQNDSFFVVQDGTHTRTVKVDMMSCRAIYKYKFLQDLNVEVVGLPYANSDISMVILVPKAVEGIDNLLNNLGGLNIHGLMEDSADTDLELFLPKFKLKYSVDLKDVVRKIGVKEIFEKPNFNAMTNETNLRVDKILQEAVIEVNEKGTEAAAVQVIVGEFSSSKLMFRVNRPFVFYLKDDKRIYLAGQVRDPSF